MQTSWLITNFIAAFLLPPLSLLLPGALGVWLLGRRRRQWQGKALIIFSLAAVYLLSTQYVSGWLLDLLKPPFQAPQGNAAQAIVILGGGRHADSLEYGGDSLGRHSLERVRYGAWLARQVGKPVLVTGGAPGGGQPEAELMRAALETEFGIPVRWTESRALTTLENARHSAALLKQDGIRDIYLVTHAWHLARAIPEFERQGLRVIPSGTGYGPPQDATVLDFLPNGKGMHDSYLAIHEAIGLVWYRIRNLF